VRRFASTVDTAFTHPPAHLRTRPVTREALAAVARARPAVGRTARAGLAGLAPAVGDEAFARGKGRCRRFRLVVAFSANAVFVRASTDDRKGTECAGKLAAPNNSQGRRWPVRG